MRCRIVLCALLALALPARAESIYPDATYRTEAEAPAVSEAGEIAFVSDADLAPRGTETGDAGGRCSPGNADGSDEIFLFRPGAIWPFVQLTDDPAGSQKSSVAIGRDGRALLWAEERQTKSGTLSRLYLLPLGRRQPLLLLEGRGQIGMATVSDRRAHGYRVAATEEVEGAARVRLFDTRFDPAPRALPGEAFPGRDPSLSRDGSRLAYTAPDAEGRSQVRLRDLGDAASGDADRAITAGEADSARPRVSGDGGHVVFESRANLAVLNRDGNREIFLYGVVTRRLTQITRTEAGVENRSPRVNGNGTRVAFLSNGNLVGRNADGNEEIFLWIAGGSGHGSAPAHAASPPRLRQVTDTRPDPITDPGPAPYPIG